jgi:hypothetical protein
LQPHGEPLRFADGPREIPQVKPLDELGFQPEAGKEYRGDFGVVYSDAKGTTNRLRMHWATRDTGLVSDAYNETKVRPAEWGRIRTR